MNMRGMLPGKRKTGLFLVVLVLVMALIAILLWFRREEPKPGNLAARPVVLRQDQLEKLNRDDDEDGLKNWEEAIYRTDPRKKDSDGDGTDDGMEVAQGRDPLIPGPNDRIVSNPEQQKKTSTGPNLTSEFTETFLREPIAQIIAGQRPEIDTVSVEAYTQRLMNRSVLSPERMFTEKDLKKTSANDLNSLRQYLRAFDTAWQPLKSRGENEIDVTAEAFQKQEYEGLKILDDYGAAYQKTIEDMKDISVPTSFGAFHIIVLNYLEKFKMSAKIMRNAESDPMLAMLAINERIKVQEEFKTYMQGFKKQISDEVAKSK